MIKLFVAFFALLAAGLLVIGSYQALIAVERTQIDILMLALTSLYLSVLFNAFENKEKKRGEQ